MTTYATAGQVPSDVLYLADGNNVLFRRDEDELDLWHTVPLMWGMQMPLARLFAEFGDLMQVDHLCINCSTKPGETCCSSHGKHLCHRCYRRTHFVEVCIAGCKDCAREGLPVVLSEGGAA